MNVYDISRVKPQDVPQGYDDDVKDVHFVPAPCQVACPIGTDAPSYIAYIWEGRIEQAYEAITATNPFSSVCARVCDAPCEPACRRADSDGPLAIRNLKRFVMDRLGKDYRAEPFAVTRTESVAIVGGGPAGLTAAQDLAQAGFQVHVYEMTKTLGGMMRWGIPEFRLPTERLAEDVDRLLARCPGITVHLETPLGEGGVTLDQLKERHDAVLLTIGSWWGKTMRIPGDADPRVVDGVGFLRRINDGERPEMPETVLVIGGGDVAMDACRAAKRLPGCKTVKVLYRRGPHEIPARRDELEGAFKEDIEFDYNIQPVSVVADGDRFALRCVRTELGAPEADGRRRPVNVPGSEHDVECGMVIMAIGQQAASAELDGKGLMASDRVRTDWHTMRTDDPKVFAAGDGAFGGSTIVMAMMHGHRAAYYVKAHLDGIADPLPYRTPYRTRRVAVAQDANWEVFNRHEQAFHGLGANPAQFPEIESTYEESAAINEAARCYRCDAETGASDYNVHTREDIFVMARTEPEDGATQKAILDRRADLRSNPYPEGHKPTLDDLVFLPANLSRLVIDPYRDACNTAVTIGGRLEVSLPFLVGGFDNAPEQVRDALAQALVATDTAYVGRTRPGYGAKWLQIIHHGADTPDPMAQGHIHLVGDGFAPFHLDPEKSAEIVGLVATGKDLEAAIPFALEQGMDLLLVDGTGDMATDWSELSGPPDMTAMRDMIRIMRGMNREEDLDILYLGGIRSGTDGAKLISLGANASIVSMGMALALGGDIVGRSVVFHGDRDAAERIEAASLYLQALSAECSIMARCTGKTDVRNLEPEDLRAITLPTAAASGIPLAGVIR